MNADRPLWTIYFCLFEHYQLWMMDSKAQRVLQRDQNCLCSTLKSGNVIILRLERLFQESQNPKMESAG